MALDLGNLDAASRFDYGESISMIYHIYSNYSAGNTEEFARNKEAYQSWVKYWRDAVEARPTDEVGAARIPGESLGVPFVGELMGPVDDVAPADIIILTNMDTIVNHETLPAIEAALAQRDSISSRRWDIDANGKEHRHPGHDLFAFRRRWWLSGSSVNRMLIAYEGWDWVLWQEMTRVQTAKPIVWHRQHDQFWRKDRLAKAGNEWNLRTIWGSRFREEALKERQFRQAFSYYGWR